MKFDDLKEKSYYRDRTFEGIISGREYAYFEELRILKKEEEHIGMKRIHIHFSLDGVKDFSDTIIVTMKKSQWNSMWEKQELITKSDMNRRVIIYTFENAGN
jgi:hypothetical protein